MYLVHLVCCLYVSCTGLYVSCTSSVLLVCILYRSVCILYSSCMHLAHCVSVHVDRKGSFTSYAVGVMQESGRTALIVTYHLSLCAAG